ncbi:endonuclease/exonuclease/phosphatase family protein [Bifidobacterium jacchi]|uniref:endonuclease/exonuclease/phosphatase family protein n=1 Tax=Bifidobacterium jacchi TaxID=2490545 RepID=UPI0015881622|nr:endonuclease/exonuclease/phosphatase family protein [Bifidobacterium jacchi]
MSWLIWTCLVILALWIALGSLPAGADAHMPLPYMIALIPLMWVPAAALAILAAVMRNWPALAVALALLLAARLRHLRYWLHPLQKHDGSSTAIPPVKSASATVTTMTLNCRYGRADASDIVAKVRDHHVDVLALQEMTDDLVKRLEQAGLQQLLPYRQLGESHERTDNGGFNGIWSAIRPVASTHSIIDIPAADVPAITLEITDRLFMQRSADGSRGDTASTTTGSDATIIARSAAGGGDTAGMRTMRLTFASVHTKSPMRGCREWSAGIRGLGGLIAMSRNDYARYGSIIAMGDLNATIDHPSWRELLREGFQDTTLQLAHGHTNTFARWLPWPRLELDHVMIAAPTTSAPRVTRHATVSQPQTSQSTTSRSEALGPEAPRPEAPHSAAPAETDPATQTQPVAARTTSVVINDSDHLALIATLRI